MKTLGKQTSKKMNLGLASILLIFILSACGGGDGGGGGLAYSGPTTQATLTPGNAGDLATAAFDGSAAAYAIPESLPFASVSTTAAASGGTESRILLLAKTAKRLINILKDNQEIPTVSNARVIIDGPGTYKGDVDGTLILTMTDNGTSGTVGATFIGFSDVAGEVIDGTIIMTGIVSQTDPNDPATILMTASMTVSLTIKTAAGDDFSADGTMTSVLAIFADPITEKTTINMVLTDNNLQESYWVKDYTLTLTTDLFIKTVALSGNCEFYDPVEGYVIVSTPEALTVDDVSACPSAGTIKIEGENGFAIITMTGNCTYNLLVDYTDPAATDYTESGLTWQ